MGFDFHYMLELLPILLKYLGTTLEMASWGLVFALILALFLANIRVFKVPVLDPLSQLYISFFPRNAAACTVIFALLRFTASLPPVGWA